MIEAAAVYLSFAPFVNSILLRALLNGISYLMASKLYLPLPLSSFRSRPVWFSMFDCWYSSVSIQSHAHFLPFCGFFVFAVSLFAVLFMPLCACLPIAFCLPHRLALLCVFPMLQCPFGRSPPPLPPLLVDFFNFAFCPLPIIILSHILYQFSLSSGFYSIVGIGSR